MLVSVTIRKRKRLDRDIVTIRGKGCVRGCPRPEPGSSAAAPLDFEESLIGCFLQKCPGLGEAEAAALDMLREGGFY